jgi:hypothetical protein
MSINITGSTSKTIIEPEWSKSRSSMQTKTKYGKATVGSTVVPNGLAPEIRPLSGGAGDFGTMEWGYPIVRDE